MKLITIAGIHSRGQLSAIGRKKKLDYSYKPAPIFYGKTKAHLGIELEVDGSYDDIDECVCNILGYVNHQEWRIYAKDDGSLDEGFELVSMPATLDYHLKEMPWKYVMESAKRYGFTSHDAYTCGLHVHISNKAFLNYTEGVTKLVILFEKFWSKIVVFSRRLTEQIEDYAKPYSLDYTADNLFEEIISYNNDDRYYAINLQNSNTVEIRLFRGTLNYNTFAATLQFTQLCIDTVNELNETEIKNISWDDFILRGWRYKEFNTYLRKRGLAALTTQKRRCV